MSLYIEITIAKIIVIIEILLIDKIPVIIDSVLKFLSFHSPF